MKQLIFIFIFLSTTVFATESGRLNPHQKEDIDLYKSKESPNCLICHTHIKKNSYPVIKDAQGVCTSCHGEVPHSGLKEHLTKKYKGKKIDCLTCHRAHEQLQKNEKHIIIKNRKSILISHLYKLYKKRSSRDPMLKKGCLDCHKDILD